MRNANEIPVRRVRAFDALVIAKFDRYLEIAREYLIDGSIPLDVQRGVLLALSRSKLLETGDVLISTYEHLAPELQPLAIELLTQQPLWVPKFLNALERKMIARDNVNVNQIATLARNKNPDIAERVAEIFGTVRTERNPQREQVVAQMRELVQKHSGDPHKGVAVFHKLCGQCHKIHGQGQDVGPDITVNGRASIDQLLSNVFDPSLVIGQIYQAYTVVTTDGRTLTGLSSKTIRSVSCSKCKAARSRRSPVRTSTRWRRASYR